MNSLDTRSGQKTHWTVAPATATTSTSWQDVTRMNCYSRLRTGMSGENLWSIGLTYIHPTRQRDMQEFVLDNDMKGLRKILQVSWTAKKTNERVLNKAGVKRELLDTVKARKLAYYGLTMRKQGSCLQKEIMQGTMPGARRRGRPRTAWMENIMTWTGLPVKESVRMTEDRDK